MVLNIKRWKKEYGNQAPTELDALHPEKLKQLVINSLDAVYNVDEMDEQRIKEQEERNLLKSMRRKTVNFLRDEFLELIADMEPDPPPHSVSEIKSKLEDMHRYGSLKHKVTKQQLHRTVNDLWYAGLIVASRTKVDVFSWCQPYWERQFQLSESVDKTWIITEVNRLHRKTERAKFGITFFGSAPFDYGLIPDEAKELEKAVRSLIQQTHPDKQTGYEDEFIKMKDSLALIKSGIPLPDDPVESLQLFTPSSKQLETG